MEATYLTSHLVKTKLPYITDATWDEQIKMFQLEAFAYLGNVLPTTETRPTNADIFDEAYYSLSEKSLVSDIICAQLLSSKGVQILGNASANPTETSNETVVEGQSKFVSKAEAGSVNAEFSPIKETNKTTTKPIHVKDHDLRVAAQTLYVRFVNSAISKAGSMGIYNLPFFETDLESTPHPFIT